LTGIEVPIVQAPMAGGAATPELIAAVSNAGGLGSLGAAYSSPDAIRSSIADLQSRTSKPFNVNLFVLDPPRPDAGQIDKAMELLQPLKDALGLPRGDVPTKFAEDFAAQLEAVVAARPPVASFTFGILSREQVAALKAGGTLVIGTATSVAEARAWEAGRRRCGLRPRLGSGRASGNLHRQLRSVDDRHDGAGAAKWRTQCACPSLRQGGIMDGRGIAAALVLGASAVQLGHGFPDVAGSRHSPRMESRAAQCTR
jgi:nitronate monooxygenase